MIDIVSFPLPSYLIFEVLDVVLSKCRLLNPEFLDNSLFLINSMAAGTFGTLAFLGVLSTSAIPC